MIITFSNGYTTQLEGAFIEQNCILFDAPASEVIKALSGSGPLIDDGSFVTVEHGQQIVGLKSNQAAIAGIKVMGYLINQKSSLPGQSVFMYSTGEQQRVTPEERQWFCGKYDLVEGSADRYWQELKEQKEALCQHVQNVQRGYSQWRENTTPQALEQWRESLKLGAGVPSWLPVLLGLLEETGRDYTAVEPVDLKQWRVTHGLSQSDAALLTGHKERQGWVKMKGEQPPWLPLMLVMLVETGRVK